MKVKNFINLQKKDLPFRMSKKNLCNGRVFLIPNGSLNGIFCKNHKNIRYKKAYKSLEF